MTQDDLYHEQVLEELHHPRHHGLLQHPTHSANTGNASCGDTVHVTLVVAGGKIVDVGWEGEGCAISTAAMSLVSDTIIGKTLEEVTRLGKQDILTLLGLDTLSLSRLQCAQVGLNAVKQALAEPTK